MPKAAAAAKAASRAAGRAPRPVKKAASKPSTPSTPSKTKRRGVAPIPAKATRATAKPSSRTAKPTTTSAKTSKRAAVSGTKVSGTKVPGNKVSGSRASKAPAPKAAARTKTPAATPEAAALKKAQASDKFLEEQRALLLADRDVHLRQADVLRAEADQLAAEMEPGDIQFDEESGEGATVNVERERDLALSAQARAAVEEINRALAKVDAGTYGLCEKCGQPIPRARLRALPHAALCVACKSGGLSRR